MVLLSPGMRHRVFGFICFFHTLCHQAYGSRRAGRAQALGTWWMKGDQDGSILRVSLEILLCFGSVRLAS